MNDHLYINARLLRDHVSDIQDERRTARRLRDAVKMMRDLGDPMQAGQYRRILDTTNNLVQYFEKMTDVFEDISDDADLMIKRIRRLLMDDIERVQSESGRIML